MIREGLKEQSRLWIFATVAILTLAASGSLAQEADVEGLIERGGASYRTYCGSCHGLDATGDGVLAAYLKTPPPDLTRISSQSQGVFPFEEIYDIVEGRETPGHGTRAMPVWGPAFLGLSEEPDKRVVKEKVVELVYYLKSLQPAVVQAHPKMGGTSN